MRIFNNSHIIVLAWTLLLVSMFVACSGDESAMFVDNDSKMQVMPYSRMYVEEAGSNSLPEGYESFATIFPDNNDSIVVYLATSDHCERAGSFMPTKGSAWTSSVEVAGETQYYVYGFYPATGISDESITSADYSQGAMLTLPHLKTFSTTDVLVIAGIETVGNYGYYGPAEGNTAINTLYLDHIYSCVSLQFKVDADYDALRTIRLKEVRMKRSSGYEKATATVSHTANAMNPITVSWSNEGTATEVQTDNLVTEASGMTLTTAFQTIPELYLPGAETLTFDLVCSYDVYDKKGTLVRKDCQAKNRISIGNSLASPGKRNCIRLTVMPTYLYQLSDPDLDNPTIKIS